MTSDPPALVELLRQRLQVVQEISSLQSRNLLNHQVGGGAELEIVQIERDIANEGRSQSLVRALEDARERLQRASDATVECDAHCAVLERRLEELDKCIAAGR
jgi:hypothetical protein